jgi:FkbM family methyltransferase
MIRIMWFKIACSAYNILVVISEKCGMRNLPISKKLAKILRRMLRCLAPSEVMIKVHGYTMIVPRDFALYGVRPYEAKTTELLLQLLRHGMTFVDVGAHVGYYSLLASIKVGPEGKIYSFEPEPYNYNLLVKNIMLNDCKNIFAIQKAVADFTGKANFVIAPYSVSHSLYPDKTIPNIAIIQIEVVSLDDFFSQLGWPKVDIIKMDIEGAEVKALCGMKELCKRYSDLILITEFKPRRLQAAGSSKEEFFEVLSNLGFNRIYDIETGDGIILKDKKILSQFPLKSTNLICWRSV